MRNKINIKLWQGVAIVTGVFSFIICILLIANYVNINRADPVNTETLDLLIERLNDNPDDDQLREQIRQLDLLARKAYFTTQWQIRTGGYLLLVNIALMVIALQIIISNRKKEPVISEKRDEAYLLLQKTARKWISISGALVIIVALVFAFLSHQKLENKFRNAAISQKEIETPNEEIEIINDNRSTTQIIDTENKQEAEQNEISEDTKLNLLSSSDTVEIDIQKKEKAISDSGPADRDDNYTSFRGPGGNGIVIQKNIPVNWDGKSGKNVLWKTAIPLRGFNSPILWGDNLFLTGADDKKKEVYCLNRNTGEIIWTTVVDNIPGSPSQAPDVPQYTGHAAPTATTDGKSVFAIFANGDIIALSMNGRRIWAKNLGLPDNHYGHSSSLIMYEDKVIVQYDQKNITQLMALSASTGEAIWTTKRNVKVAWSSPVIVSTGNRMEIILSAEPYVASYDPDTGKELWNLDCMYGEVGPSIAYAGGIVFAMNDYSKLVGTKR